MSSVRDVVEWRALRLLNKPLLVRERVPPAVEGGLEGDLDEGGDERGDMRGVDD